MHIPKAMSRRTALRGLGTIIALPALEAMTPLFGAAGAEASRGNSGPVRLAWIHTTSGIRMPRFTPTELGRNFKLTPILSPLSGHQGDFSVLSGLYHQNAFKTVPSLGRHELDTVCYLTGADLTRIPGVAAKNAVSIDQVAGRALGKFTRMPTLNLSAFPSSKLIYDESGTPIPSSPDPVAVFDRMFGVSNMDARSRAVIERRQDSVLDLALDSTKQLKSKLGSNDRDKVEEYLNSLREVEKRVQTSRRWADQPVPKVPGNFKRPSGTPENLTERIRLMMDLAVLSFQTDQTRVLTLHLGSMECKYPEIGCQNGFHSYTHTNYKDYTDESDPMARVDAKRLEHLAYFIGKLKSVKEGESNLFDASFIHYGSGMGLGHETTALPNLIAGRANGALLPGVHKDYQGKPLAGLFLTMLAAAGVEQKRFADASEGLSV